MPNEPAPTSGGKVMLAQLQIDRSSDLSAYRQIIERIASLVQTGRLSPGGRLPTERELSSWLRVARGTVTKAYAELSRSGLIEITPGRGAFVSSRQDVIPAGRNQRAMELISSLVNDLTDLRFSYREIKSMVDLAVLEREERLEGLSVALVDCSPEALTMLCHQLTVLSRIPGKSILLDELASDRDPARRLSAFDLIVTTATHYSEVLGLAPSLQDRMVRVVVSPSQQTIVSLAGLRPSQTIGVLCESRQFLGIVKQKLEDLSLANEVGHLTWPCAVEQIEAFLAEKDVLIVPPVFSRLLNRETAPVLTEFTQGGGRIIPFDYQIERGSMVYLEERIKHLKV
jgi:DNA-binding transcriptional regulator YhcF (GntR family)